MEDVTDMMAVAETLAGHAKQFEAKLTERTQRLEGQIAGLAKELKELRKKS
jgi:DNA-binding FrmR family transcriptional regulator